ncbi:hypothetical protein GCM10010123_38150 [Pilimelia anulata]|uniref:DUF418 domain-containing protein n=1 Tax=Pilimelia anulata TaxID=53371 RepID=A0A8J3BFV7_9ACTN|nr:DUF418 domain-containing protein [Pilimelia anulata]GGK04570.1 hypothetical protein GCM10010123_38150 [Pilimelia anulata]
MTDPAAGPAAAAEPAGPDRATPLADRALGPDLARGFMLLFIALANSHYFLTGGTVRGGYPQDGSTLDACVVWLLSTLADGRAFPMFGLLFGYGVARIADRQRDRGPRGVRRLLWRRGLVLVVVGFLHAVLLYAGDILTAYGVLLLPGALLVRWRDRWLFVVAALCLLLTALPGDALLRAEPPDPSLLPPDPATAVVARAGASLYVALLGPIGFLGPFVLGLWAGRRRILEEPDRHRTLLRAAAALGIGAAVLGAQPAALVLAGALPVPDRSTIALISPLHDATGLLGGLGYAALLALLAARLRNRPRGPVVDAIAATGQRSMTCYLAQSPVWTVAFTPFLLDLSGTLTVAGTALLAAATWLGTVLLAEWMRRAGNRGPFELLVRRFTYRKPHIQTIVNQSD